MTHIVPAPDGGMLVVATAPDDPLTLFLDRLRDDGSLDPTFRGSVSEGTPPIVDLAPDGRITWVESDPPAAQRARRLLADGTVDATFVAEPGRTDRAVDAAATPEGGIVAIGDGTVTTWDANGTVQLVELPPGWTPMAVDDDGRILALRPHAGLHLGRFLPSGSPDATFGNGGAVCTTAASPTTDTAVGALNDGSIIVGVRIDTGYRLTRVTPDGEGLEATCASEPASFTAPFVPSLVQADGRYLYGPGSIRRILPDGSPDHDFGRGGTLLVPGGSSAIALDADGRILIGRSRDDGKNDRVILRYLP